MRAGRRKGGHRASETGSAAIRATGFDLCLGGGYGLNGERRIASISRVTQISRLTERARHQCFQAYSTTVAVDLDSQAEGVEDCAAEFGVRGVLPSLTRGHATNRGSDCHDSEAGNSFELGRVGGRDFHAMTYGGRRDPHVVGADHFTVSL